MLYIDSLPFDFFLLIVAKGTGDWSGRLGCLSLDAVFICASFELDIFGTELAVSLRVPGIRLFNFNFIIGEELDILNLGDKVARVLKTVQKVIQLKVSFLGFVASQNNLAQNFSLASFELSDQIKEFRVIAGKFDGDLALLKSIS